MAIHLRTADAALAGVFRRLPRQDDEMSESADLLSFLAIGEPVKAHRPVARVRLAEDGWQALASRLEHVSRTQAKP